MTDIIRYTIKPFSWGNILVATSDVGICAILIDDAPSFLTSDLHARFPKSDIKKDDASLDIISNKVIDYILHPAEPLNEKLDLRGTDFQKKVWQQLLKIPAGKTATYIEIASTLGSPKLVRAVGGACAANALAVVIPCHRVVKSNGDLSGYRWGIERKRRLLELEGAISSGPLQQALF